MAASLASTMLPQPAAQLAGASAATPPANAWWRPSRRTPERRRRGGACCSSAKSDVGRLLRDALAQPAQGQNLQYLAAGNFLRGLGIDSQAEVNRILDIAMNPNSMYTSRNRKQPTNPHARRLDVEADLRPVVEFLQQGAGLSQAQVAKMIAAHPALLCYSVPDRLQPFFSYLTGELGLSAGEAAGVVERRPTLVGVEVAGLRRMVGFLQESGTSREELLELLSTTL